MFVNITSVIYSWLSKLSDNSNMMLVKLNHSLYCDAILFLKKGTYITQIIMNNLC